MSKSEPMRDLLTMSDDFRPVFLWPGYYTGYMSNYHSTGPSGEYGYEDIKPTHVEIGPTLWGDYCGNCCYRSNCRALLREFPRSLKHATGDYGSEVLYVNIRNRNEALFDALSGLVDYPLYDEEDHSSLEHECAEEAWELFVFADAKIELQNRARGKDTRGQYEIDHGINPPHSLFPGVPEFLDAYFDGNGDDAAEAHAEEVARNAFYGALQDCDDSPYLESADSIVFPSMPKQLDAIEEAILADVLADYQ